jgi:uncharacterized protein YyaL (SSP411 family)
MPNRLANENSPYLLQHKNNPVDWYPWGEEALQKARDENKPIFLSIGYAACHWCHVMERESFEDPETANLMNANFVNVKVDREERPDLDRIYMTAVISITGQGGWPMSVFLTPEGKPFFGGTYFPPVRRFGMPSFQEVLTNVTNLWNEEQEDILTSGDNLTQHIQRNMQIPVQDDDPLLDPAILEQAQSKAHQQYDWNHGGWGQAPRFPQAMNILFLLRRASRGETAALEMSIHALEAMAKGGMYDLIGGGFARYSVDDAWLVPHFEKMLYDNALLSRTYLHAYLITGNEHFRQVCEETLDFVQREMTHPEGGFYSSIDADSEGEEGLFYTWTHPKLEKALTSEEMDAFAQAYTVPVNGNFEGRIVLQRKIMPEIISPLEEILARARRKLFELREQRVRPETDDKILVAWNSLMAISFAEAGRYLKNKSYLKVAQKNLEFLTTSLDKDGVMQRSWREGKAQHRAYLEDHAGLALALLTLYQSDHDTRLYQKAVEVAETMISGYYDPVRGFYDTAHDHEALILRPQESQDNATPSGTSLAVQVLLTLAAFSGEGRYYDIAAGTLSPMQAALASYPTAFGNWLSGLDLALANIKEVALIGDPGSTESAAVLDIMWGKFRPDMVLAASQPPADKFAPPLVHNRQIIDGLPTVYVCRQFVCQQPTTDLHEIKAQLA